MHQKEQADKARRAAALTLAKLERWQALSLSIYDELQPVYVETSEILAKDFDIIKARDYLWKKSNAIKTEIFSKRSEENIEVIYVELYGYHPGTRELFLSTMKELHNEEKKMFNLFIAETQGVVLEFDRKRPTFTTAKLGNELRKTSDIYYRKQEQSLEKILLPITEFLAGLVLRPDESVLTQGIAEIPSKRNQSGG